MTDSVTVSRPTLGHGRRRPLHVRPLVLAMAGVCVVPTALAQEAGAARSTTLVPSLSVSETYTDNALLRDDDKRGDLVSQLTVGLSLGHRSARLTGSLDYSISGSAHARETKANEVTQGLRAQLRGELVSNWLYVDSSASISQQAISAFGLQSADTAFDNPNRTEVRSLNLSPYLLRPLGTWGQIEARLQHGRQSAASTSLGDSTSNTGSLVMSSQGAPRLGWSISAVRQRVDYESGRQSTTDALSLGANYRVGADLRLNGSIGRDKSDIVSIADTNSTTWGLGLQWLPSEAMYESFYGLTSKPFQLNPDPNFYFGSKQHRRAKAYLEYGVSRNEGFIVITGEIGAGKTTLLRSLIDGLHGSNVIAGHLVTTQLGPKTRCAWWARPSASASRTCPSPSC
jgi:hypothetical protein